MLAKDTDKLALSPLYLSCQFSLLISKQRITKILSLPMITNACFFEKHVFIMRNIGYQLYFIYNDQQLFISLPKLTPLHPVFSIMKAELRIGNWHQLFVRMIRVNVNIIIRVLRLVKNESRKTQLFQIHLFFSFANKVLYSYCNYNSITFRTFVNFYRWFLLSWVNR